MTLRPLALLAFASLLFTVAAAQPAAAKNFKMGPITVDLGVEVLVLSVFSKPGAANPAQMVQFKILDDQGKVVAKTDPAPLPPGSGAEFEWPQGPVVKQPRTFTGVVKVTGETSTEGLSASLQLVQRKGGELNVLFPRRPTRPDADARDALVYPPLRVSPDDLLTLSVLFPEDPCGIRYTLYDMTGNVVSSYEIPASGTGGVAEVVDLSNLPACPAGPCNIVGVVEAVETNGQAPAGPIKIFSTQQIGEPTMVIQEDRSKFNVIGASPPTCADVDCDDGSECTADLCDDSSGAPVCSNVVTPGAQCGVAGICDDSGVCVEPCSGCIENGQCIDLAETTRLLCGIAGATCVACLQGEECVGGVCAPDPCAGVACPDQSACTVGVCDGSSGTAVCGLESAPAGTPCAPNLTCDGAGNCNRPAGP